MALEEAADILETAVDGNPQAKGAFRHYQVMALKEALLDTLLPLR